MNYMDNCELGSYTSELAEEVAKSLHKAMKGIGTDEKMLIKNIVSHSNSQRQVIKKTFLTLYGKTLAEAIKSETSGDFRKSLLALLEPTDEYEARCVQEAIKGTGTNELVLIQTLCPKGASEIQVLKEAYSRLFNKELEKEVAEDVSGSFGRLMRSIVSAGRADEYAVDQDLARKEAQELYDAGEGRFGTDDSEFIRIFCSRSFGQLWETCQYYKAISGADIEEAIKKEFSGSMEKACLAIVRVAKNRAAYYAHELYESMVGAGTRDNDLIRLLVSKSEDNLQEIKTQYYSMYGKSLYDAVKSELGGDYKKLLLELIGGQ